MQARYRSSMSRLSPRAPSASAQTPAGLRVIVSGQQALSIPAYVLGDQELQTTAAEQLARATSALRSARLRSPLARPWPGQRMLPLPLPDSGSLTAGAPGC